MALFLAKNSHQHIRAGHFTLAGGLHVKNGALNDTLKTHCLMNLGAIGVFIEQRHLGCQVLLQLFFQAVDIGIASDKDIARDRLFEQSQQ